MYAAAKGISRSRLEDRSLALFIGMTIKPAITKSGSGTKIRRGKIPYSKAVIPAMIETGTVNIATKNISEMYVSGKILTRPLSRETFTWVKTFFKK
jgi:hypothetical protein